MLLQKHKNLPSQPHNHIIAQCLINSKGLNYNQLQFPFMYQMSFCYKKIPNKTQKTIKTEEKTL